MRYIATIVIIIVLISGMFLSHPSKRSTAKPIERINRVIALQTAYNAYCAAVLDIQRKAGDLDVRAGLFMFENFRKMYENPEPNYENAIHFICDSSFTEDQKSIVLYSMLKLNLTEYVEMVTIIYGLYRQKRVSEGFLSNALGYSFNSDPVLVKNFKDQRVRNLLFVIQKDSTVPAQIKKSLPDILGGKEYWDLLEFRWTNYEVSF